MEKDAVIQRCFFIAVVVIATAMLFSCQNNPKQPMGLENMPEFEQKFPQKSVWLHHHTNDSTEITFSSMEEAEWKLVHFVPNCSYEDFEKNTPVRSFINGLSVRFTIP